MKVERRSACTGHRCCYLLAYDPRLPYPENHNLSAALRQQLDHSLDLRAVKSRRRLSYRIRLDSQQLLDFCKVAVAHCGL